ncbi:acyl-CoA dehydrogenase family protein [Variovorax ureilyticus]|uniref:Acyl-CoA dehydrogenase family protein n=1 Tax=Variovorax ureilyticus TaxID=1836198 RepID=A0ABU8VSM1_9BURK
MTDITLDQDQRMLVDSARRYVERAYDARLRERSIAHESGCLPDVWRTFADMGWLAMAVPEAVGGLGAQTLDLCLLAEELGRGAVNEPWTSSGVLAASLLPEAAPPAFADAWLGGVMDGSRRIAFVPAQSGLVLRDEGLLNGSSGLVVGGSGVAGWLVQAGVGERREALVWVEANATGVESCSCTLYDGRGAARLRFADTQTTVIVEGDSSDIAALVARASDRAMLAHCAETVGGMQRALDVTLEYLKTRRQFGRAVASNQVVQHRLVDLLVEIEEARALTHAAARMFDDPASAGTARARMTAAATAYVARAARQNWKQCVQLHGAIGMTQEYELGHFVRRLAAAATLCGGESQSLERLAALSLDQEEAFA